LRSGIEAETELNLIATAISDPASLDEGLGEGEPRTGLVLRQARATVQRVADQTRWPVEELLDRLGCRQRQPGELAALAASQVERCGEYFEWVEQLAELVDRPPERRRVVIAAARLYRRAGFDLRLADRAMATGRFSATSYLELGEIDSGFLRAERKLERRPSPEVRVHLRPKRIDRYLDPNDSSISPCTRDRIAVHLITCRGCAEAVRLRRARRRRLIT
jgi:hypothetical protein